MIKLESRELKNIIELLGKFSEISSEAEIVSDGEKIHFHATHGGVLLADASLEIKTVPFFWFTNISNLLKVIRRCAGTTEISENQGELIVKCAGKKFPGIGLIHHSEAERYKYFEDKNYKIVSSVEVEKLIDGFEDVTASGSEDISFKAVGQSLLMQGWRDNVMRSETVIPTTIATVEEQVAYYQADIFNTILCKFGKTVKVIWESDKPMIVYYEKEGMKLRFVMAPKAL